MKIPRLKVCAVPSIFPSTTLDVLVSNDSHGNKRPLDTSGFIDEDSNKKTKFSDKQDDYPSTIVFFNQNISKETSSLIQDSVSDVRSDAVSNSDAALPILANSHETSFIAKDMDNNISCSIQGPCAQEMSLNETIAGRGFIFTLG